MTRIHFVGGEKGGVGKSVVSRMLMQYFIDRQTPFLGFDTDKSHESLRRFYNEFASALLIERFEDFDVIVETAAREPDRRVVVDLAAQTHRLLAQWMEDSGLLDPDSGLDLSLTYWHVMDSGRDSTEFLATLLDRLGRRLEVVVVLNEVRGADFSILEASGTLARAKDMGASVMSLRRLQESTMQKIDAQNTSFWAASHRPGNGGTPLGLLERQRVKTWLHNTYKEFDRISL
jgi:hypothetical protein